MVLPQGGRIYESPPGSGGNDGAPPTVYDVRWPAFTNLTPSQITAFQAFPQDLTSYATSRRWLAEISGVNLTFTPSGQAIPITIPIGTDDRAKVTVMTAQSATAVIKYKDAAGTYHTFSVTDMKAITGAQANFANALHNAESTLLAGINATPQTITTRAQVDSAYAAIAPNSASATGQG